MKITLVQSPVWSNAEHESITCFIKTDVTGNELLEFAANPLDIEEHGRTLFAELIAGVHGQISEYVAPVFVPIIVDGIEQPVTTGAQTL